MTITTLKLFPKPPFNFAATATASGWVELSPTSWDVDKHSVTRIEQLSTGKVIALEICGDDENGVPIITVQIHTQDQLSIQEEKEVATRVGYMFRIDEDLSNFYDICQEKGGQWTRLTKGLGHLFRSSSLYEDLVKTICTTNVQWGGTKGMVRRMVDNFGAPLISDPRLHAFPTPQAINEITFDEFSKVMRMGYRAQYVYDLSLAVAENSLNLNQFVDSEISTVELRKRLLKIKGIGPYAAATLLMLLGHYDELAIDTAFRSFVGKKYFNNDYPSDKVAQEVYQDWGRWKYLAYWFDIWSEYTEN